MENHDYTMEEAIEYLNEVNINSDFKVNILYYDTLAGLSTRNEGKMVDYSQLTEAFSYILPKMVNGTRGEGSIYISSAYVNPLDGTISYMGSDVAYSKMLQIYKENLTQIGVNLKLLNMDWDAQMALAKSPDRNDCQDIMLMKWWPDYADPAGWFTPLLMNSKDSVGYNFCYLDDDVFGEENREAVRLTATDKGAAEELYIQMQEKLLDECYMIYAYNAMQYYVVSNAISGVYENPAYQTCIYYYGITTRGL